MKTAAHRFSFALLLLVGCTSLPDGTNLQVTSTGFDFAPAGNGPGSPSLTLGTKSLLYSTAPKQDAGPQINRFQVSAGSIKSIGTTAQGVGVGDELEKAGPVIQALQEADQLEPLPAIAAPSPSFKDE